VPIVFSLLHRQAIGTPTAEPKEEPVAALPH
jgi:hypothetical protein